MLQSSVSASRPRRLVFDARYSLVALVYVAMVYWLASRPEPGKATGELVARLLTNLYHIPLYAGLGFFILQAISQGQALAAHRWMRAAVTLLAAGAVAILDEWRQAYIPGRDPSLSDFLLDLTGIAGVLVACALGTTKEPRP